MSSAGPALDRGTGRSTIAQAWIVPVSEDPEAVSALAVARRFLGAAELRTLRRARLIEIEGVLPAVAELAERLHDSTRFYNPHKERCHLRVTAADPAPLAPGERAVLVFDRGGERREGAERWWKRTAGGRVQVREGTAWIAEAADPAATRAWLEALVEVRDARHGLLCNHHAQEARPAGDRVPLDWFRARAAKGRASR